MGDRCICLPARTSSIGPSRYCIFHADELDQELGREHIKARQADHKLQMQRPLWDIRDTYKGRTAEPKVDVYNMGLFRYEGLYIGTPSMFHSNDNRWNKDGFTLSNWCAVET